MIDITKLKASGKLYELTLKDESGTIETFKVHPDTVVHHHLFNKKTLTENQVKTLKTENASTLLSEKALDYLSRKDYSRAGLKKKLALHGNSEVVESTLDYLEKVGYLNDDKALDNLVEAMWEYSLKGPGAIKDKALRENFKESAIDARLCPYKEASLDKRLTQFIKKTYPAYARYPKRKVKEKLLRQCLSNGYEADTARQVIEQFVATLNTQSMEETLLSKRVEKLKDRYDLSDFKSKGKLIQKLMREGFEYEAIKNLLK